MKIRFKNNNNFIKIKSSFLVSTLKLNTETWEWAFHFYLHSINFFVTLFIYLFFNNESDK